MPAYIYGIKNNINNQYYVGQTINWKSRWQKHLSTLQKGTHHNSHLQRAFNKYGEEHFSFELFEYIEDDSLVGEKEIEWIDKCGYYNLDKGNTKISEEGRANMSEAHIGNVSSRRALSTKQVLYVLAINSFCDNCVRPLSYKLNVSREPIKNIVSGKNYKEIVDLYNKLSFSQKLLFVSKAIDYFDYNFWEQTQNAVCPKKNRYVQFLYDSCQISATALGSHIGMTKDGVLKVLRTIRENKREVDIEHNNEELKQILLILCKNNTVLSSLIEKKCGGQL